MDPSRSLSFALYQLFLSCREERVVLLVLVASPVSRIAMQRNSPGENLLVIHVSRESLSAGRKLDNMVLKCVVVWKGEVGGHSL